jgi:hypothetical protein
MSIEKALLEVNLQIGNYNKNANMYIYINIAAFLAQTVTLDDNSIVKFEIW